MAETLTPDICVIGAGSGGLSVAAGAAAFGVPVVLVEQGKMGGDCLNTGCVPSKALLAAAKRAHAIGHAQPFGPDTARTEVDFAQVHRHVHDVIGEIAPNDSVARFTGLGVRVINGVARFRDADTVTVGSEFEIKARRIVIATGSSPAVPPIPGLDSSSYLTNESVFDLTSRPEHLVVIGGGPIGLELAQAFRRLGARVTVLEAQQPLAREDAECAAILLQALVAEDLEIRSGVTVVRVEKAPPGIHVVVRDGGGAEDTIEGTHLLVATGRRVNVDDLGLDRAGISYDRQGIKVDRRLRTTNRRVYAVGDVAGGPKFTHVANYHAGIVLRNVLFRLPASVNEDAIPRATYTDPELAHVGLTEDEARQRGRRVQVLRWPYRENDRAQAERETTGHIKVITTDRGKILGATIVGAAAGELITIWTLAIVQGLNIRSLAGIIIPYPTLSEVGKRAAITYFMPRLRSTWLRRIIVWLRRLG
jgi:pyruvate/2-oxoglutarate dehydrogenase complex dihydrolipoamide dehydrogenase (E3) component